MEWQRAAAKDHKSKPQFKEVFQINGVVPFRTELSFQKRHKGGLCWGEFSGQNVPDSFSTFFCVRLECTQHQGCSAASGR